MARRTSRSFALSVSIPLGVFVLGSGVILLGIALFSGGNLLGGLGPLGLLIQILGIAGLLVVLAVWGVKIVVRLVRGKSSQDV